MLLDISRGLIWQTAKGKSSVRLSSTWQMKHKSVEKAPAAWTKVLPTGVRKSLAEKAKPKVAVVNLHGMIAAQSGSRLSNKSLNLENLQKLIDRAFATKKLEAVFLSINSPGGSAVQSELIADYINQKSRETSVPVLSFVEDVAASGGYWLATAAPVIYVSKSSIVGSIGVISQSFGLQDAIAKLGIERRTHTAGECKAFGDPFKAQEEKDLAIVRGILSALHENFKGQVKNARGDKLKGSETKLFSGEVWVGQQAVDLGLVDGICTMHKFIETEMGGPSKVSVVKIRQPNKFPFLMSSASLEETFPAPLVTTAFAHQVAEAFMQREEDQAFFKGIRT